MASKKTCLIYLASPIESVLSTGDKRIDMLCLSLRNVTGVLQLPVIIFNEDFTEQIMANLKNIYEHKEIFVGTIAFFARNKVPAK